MKLADFSLVSKLGRIVRTGEVAAALRTSQSHASRSLRRLADQGLATHVSHGLWILGREPMDPRLLADEITRPHPAYVSFVSALSAHAIIDQVPRDISLASLDDSKRQRTAVGTFVVRHVPPELFGGWIERDGIKLATPEKALVDLAYVTSAHKGRGIRVPELDLPPRFSHRELRRWTERIPSRRLRTLTEQSLHEMLARTRD